MSRVLKLRKRGFLVSPQIPQKSLASARQTVYRMIAEAEPAAPEPGRIGKQSGTISAVAHYATANSPIHCSHPLRLGVRMVGTRTSFFVDGARRSGKIPTTRQGKRARHLGEVTRPKFNHTYAANRGWWLAEPQTYRRPGRMSRGAPPAPLGRMEIAAEPEKAGLRLSQPQHANAKKRHARQDAPMGS
jgi:hypothetical protein